MAPGSMIPSAFSPPRKMLRGAILTDGTMEEINE